MIIRIILDLDFTFVINNIILIIWILGKTFLRKLDYLLGIRSF